MLPVIHFVFGGGSHDEMECDEFTCTVKHLPTAVYPPDETEYYGVNCDDRKLVKLHNVRNRRMQRKGRDCVILFDADWCNMGEVSSEESIRRSDGSMFHIPVDKKQETSQGGLLSWSFLSSLLGY